MIFLKHVSSHSTTNKSSIRTESVLKPYNFVVKMAKDIKTVKQQYNKKI